MKGRMNLWMNGQTHISREISGQKIEFLGFINSVFTSSNSISFINLKTNIGFIAANGLREAGITNEFIYLYLYIYIYFIYIYLYLYIII